MKLGRQYKNNPWVQKTIGILAAEYLRLVWKTSRFIMEPADPYQLYDREQPVILAMWHGQHFMLPFVRRHYPFKVLISRHSDGEINAIAAEWLGVGAVRGSGDHAPRQDGHDPLLLAFPTQSETRCAGKSTSAPNS